MAINYFNPAGIPLIREKLELKWAPDSLFIESEGETVIIKVDSAKGSTNSNEQAHNQANKKLNENEEKGSKPVTINPHETEQKTAKEEKEVTAFSEPKAITLEQAYALYNKNVTFIDARDESDFLVGHITRATNIPFDDFDNHQKKLEQISMEKPLVVYCAGTDCDLSIMLGNLLFEKGYKQVYVFFGGWVEWSDANYPVEHLPE